MRKKRICFLNTRSLRRGHSSFCEEPRYYNKVQEKGKTQPNENENKQTETNLSLSCASGCGMGKEPLHIDFTTSLHGVVSSRRFSHCNKCSTLFTRRFSSNQLKAGLFSPSKQASKLTPRTFVQTLFFTCQN